jgi:DNA ligase 1
MDLKYLDSFVKDVNKTNSLNDKIATIKKWYAKDGDKLVEHLLPIYRYDVQYYLTSANLKKNSNLITEHATKQYPDLSSLLDDLAARKVSGHEAIALVNGFVAANQEHADLIYKIIDKDIEAHVDVSVINRATEDSIPTFDVVLAHPIDKATGKNTPDFDKQTWLASIKMDGCRLITIVDEKGNVNCFSRVGNRFETMARVEEDIKQLGLKSVVFDGEACIFNEKGEDFQAIMKEIRKKDWTIEKIRYKIFDFMTLEEFNTGKSKTTFTERYEALKKLNIKKLKHLDVLEQWTMDDASFEKRQAEASAKGWEGLILRRGDVTYKNGRTYDLLKVKKFCDDEYKVVGLEYDDFPYLVGEKFEKRNVVSRLVIEHKKNKVGVGSGLSQDERMEWKKDPSKIIGKTITVQYFSETTNEKGGISLRFPTLKIVHGEKRNT